MGRDDDQVRVAFSDLENAVSLISCDISVQAELSHLVSRTRSDWLSFISAEHFSETAEKLTSDLRRDSWYEDEPVRSIIDRHGECAYRIANELIDALVNGIEGALELVPMKSRCFRLARHLDEWARPRTIFRETVGLEHEYIEFRPDATFPRETAEREPVDASSSPPIASWPPLEAPPGPPPLRALLHIQFVNSTANTIEERQLDWARRECDSVGVQDTAFAAIADAIPRLPDGRTAAAAADAIHEGVLEYFLATEQIEHFLATEQRSAGPHEHILTVNVDRRTAYLNGTPILINTELQARILNYLSENPGRFCSSGEIIAALESGGPIGPRVDRVVRKFPTAIAQLIDHDTGPAGGFRLNLVRTPPLPE